MEKIIDKIKKYWNETHYSQKKDIITEIKHLLVDLEDKLQDDDQNFY